MTNHPQKSENKAIESNSQNHIAHLSKEWAKKYVQELKSPTLSSESTKQEVSEELLSS